MTAVMLAERRFTLGDVSKAIATSQKTLETRIRQDQLDFLAPKPHKWLRLSRQEVGAVACHDCLSQVIGASVASAVMHKIVRRRQWALALERAERAEDPSTCDVVIVVSFDQQRKSLFVNMCSRANQDELLMLMTSGTATAVGIRVGPSICGALQRLPV
jgi:hypothetical protein